MGAAIFWDPPLKAAKKMVKNKAGKKKKRKKKLAKVELPHPNVPLIAALQGYLHLAIDAF